MDLEQFYVQSRRGTNSMKWDALETKFSSADLLPLWVADMDFRAPECVREALKNAVDYNVYGYFMPPASYKQAFIDWEKKYHGLAVEPEWIKFAPGIVTGIFWLMHTFTQKGDACLVLTPSYYPFMEAVEHTGRRLITSRLKEENGRYSVDFDDFERKVRDEKVRLFILCSPHNPVCRVWRADELKRLLEICRRHGVLVISDEIHHDFVAEGYNHLPTLSFEEYRDMVIMLTAASKTFNMAAFKNSFVVIPNEALREKYAAFLRENRTQTGGMFGYIAVEAAYKGGREWFNTVWKQIRTNYETIRTALLAKFPKAVVTPLEATYLMWIDIGAYVPGAEIAPFVEKECHLALDYGNWFFEGGRTDDTHIRVNLATTPENIDKALSNLLAALSRRTGKA